jgi:hypothetical protein
LGILEAFYLGILGNNRGYVLGCDVKTRLLFSLRGAFATSVLTHDVPRCTGTLPHGMLLANIMLYRRNGSVRGRLRVSVVIGFGRGRGGLISEIGGVQ